MRKILVVIVGSFVLGLSAPAVAQATDDSPTSSLDRSSWG